MPCLFQYGLLHYGQITGSSSPYFLGNHTTFSFLDLYPPSPLIFYDICRSIASTVIIIMTRAATIIQRPSIYGVTMSSCYSSFLSVSKCTAILTVSSTITKIPTDRACAEACVIALYKLVGMKAWVFLRFMNVSVWWICYSSIIAAIVMSWIIWWFTPSLYLYQG